MSTAKLSTLTIADQSNALFESLRSGDISAIRNLLQVNRSLLNEKMYGFEGHDIYGSVPEVCSVIFRYTVSDSMINSQNHIDAIRGREM